jgi:hypothetical protein
MENYAREQTSLRRDVSNPNRDDDRQRCNQLAAAAPGVEELRTNGGSVESRRWTIVSDGRAPRWTLVRATGSAADGWAPKPGIDHLDFKPPLEPALGPGANHFLFYTPVDSTSPDDSRKSAAVREVLGDAQGNFTWRGRKYGYTVTPQLPCFPQAQ